MTYINILFYLKINHFSKIANKFEDLFNIGPRGRNTLSLIKLLMTVFVVLHIFASIWLFIGLI